MIFEFLKELRSQITDEEFNETLKLATQDIKSNRVGFNKYTQSRELIEICMSSLIIIQSEGR